VGYAVASFFPGEPDESRDFLALAREKAIEEAERRKKGEDEHRSLARRSLECYALTGEMLSLAPDERASLPDEMTKAQAGAFVSLHIGGRLRGCVGTIGPTTGSVADEIIQNAVSAGFHDNRFSPVEKRELPLLEYKVDVLRPAERIDDPSLLDPKRYGVIVSSKGRRGLLLPNLDGVDTVETQISIAKRKAGIGAGESVSLERFEVARHE
jgi:AmmeMemoRadiSam system protein A